MGQLTTHVLDVHAGHPAHGVIVDLQAAGAAPVSFATGRDGRVPQPLLSGAEFIHGRYVLTYHLGRYFRERGIALPEPAFLEQAVIQVGIADPAAHYHVPLIITPWSYSVYRGG